MDNYTKNGVSSVLIIFGYIFLPMLVNLCFIIFMAASYTLAEADSTNRNTIAIASMVWYYLGCGTLVVVFGANMAIWATLARQLCGYLLITLIIIFYPLYFLFTLPMTVFYVFKVLGSPPTAWQRLFSNSCMSLDHISYEYAGSYCKLIGYFMSIGLLFALFTILYVVVVFICFPFYFFLFSPFGFGPYGINIFLSLRHLSSFKEFSWDCIEKTFLWSIFCFTWMVALPAMIFAMFYMAFVLVTAWQAILLLVVSGIYFFAFLFFTITQVFCRFFARQVI